MVMHMSGTRANGDRYPPGWTPFQVEDWEGQHLIRGGMAREVATPDWAVPVPPAPEPEPAPPAPRSEPSSTAAGPADPEPELAPVVELAPPAAPPPAPSDPKQAWVDYAVTQGMDADAASRMTKADLQSRFGPRL